jgi:eukaryotic-like serine/threonine-protein kinase
VGAVPTSKIGDWVAELAATSLLERERRVEAIESRSATESPSSAPVDSELGVEVMPRAARESEPPKPASEDVLFTQLATGVSADPALMPLHARKKPRAVAFALGAGLLVAVGLAASFHRGPPVVEAAAAAASPSDTGALPRSPAPDSVGVTVARMESAPPALDGGEIEALLPPSVASPHRPTLRAPPAVAPRKGRHCDPPYTIDQQGVRTFKKECL